MGTKLGRWGWLAVVDVAILAPLAVAPVAAATQDDGLLDNLSAYSGLLAASLMVITIVLLSRVKALLRALGIETGKALHIRLGAATAAMSAAHVILAVASSPHGLASLNPLAAGPAVQTGIGAALLVALVSLRVRPRSGDRDYARRARWHAAGGIAMFALVAGHVLLLGRLVSDPLNAAVLGALALMMLAVLAGRWLVRPLIDRGAHVVQAVRVENPRVVTLVLAPLHLRRPLSLEPGQFVWLRHRRYPAATAEHPFTIAHAARNGRIEITIRTCGPFTYRLAELEPGERIWVDGPYGSFVPNLHPGDPASADGLVFIAGGVGITPIAASLRALAEAHDPRPHHLLLAERDGEELFGLELDRFLARRLNLTVRRTGGAAIDPQLLARTLPPDSGHRAYYVSGGGRLVAAAVDALGARGVPRARISTERF